MSPRESDIIEVIRRAGEELTPDIHAMVNGGITRGRARQRRARIGTIIGTLAMVGLGAAVVVSVPLGGLGHAPGDPGVASDGGSASEAASPQDDLLVFTEITHVPTPGVWRVAAADIPAAVGALALASDVSPPLDEPPYEVRDTPTAKVVHFLVNGMLATLDAKRSEPPRGARGGVVVQSGQPVTVFGVTSQSVTVWRAGWSITITSYNAAGHRDSPTIAPSPALTQQQLATVAGSALWFE